jgi:hypothetical protein
VVQLTFCNLEAVDVARLVTQLFPLENLSELVFQNCQIKELPAELAGLVRLRKLVVRQNDELDLTSGAAVIAKMSGLTALDIGENDWVSLPAQIKVMKQIRVLNLSGNNLNDIPAEIDGMTALDTLYTHGNVFVDPIGAFSRLKTLNLKCLTVDSLIADATTLITLQKLLPKTKIVAVAGVANPIAQLPDSMAVSAVRAFKMPAEDTTLFVGQFQTEKTNLKVYSDAYTQYASFFIETYEVPFDSLLFDQRFESLNYVNNLNRLRNPRNGFVGTVIAGDKKRINSGSISLLYKKDKKSGPYFVFDESNVEKSRFYNISYKELTAYNNVKWKYTGALSQREFKKRYISLKKKKIYWNDTKIVPDADFVNYQIVLKGDTGFVVIHCTPVIDGQKDKSPSVQQQKTLKQRYKLYSNLRRKRAASVNKFIIRTKQDLMILKEKERAQKWAEFQNLYMSDAEKKLSRSEWLDYYQTVMSDEANILLNSDANSANIRNALNANGYTPSFMSDYRGDSSRTVEVYAEFVNADDFLYSISDIIVINKSKRTFYSTRGSSSNKMNGFAINKTDDFAVAVETISGQILVVDGAQIRDKSQRSDVCRFLVTAIHRRMGTVSQVFNLLGL